MKKETIESFTSAIKAFENEELSKDDAELILLKDGNEIHTSLRGNGQAVSCMLAYEMLQDRSFYNVVKLSLKVYKTHKNEAKDV